MTSGAISLENWLRAPANRVAFRHVRDILPVAEVENDPSRGRHFEMQLIDTEQLTFADRHGAPWTVERFTEASYADGLLILRDGRIAFEWYAPGQSVDDEHLMFSVTKSVVGSLAGVLVEKGLLDPQAPVARYVPEMNGSGYETARVRDLLDMTVGIDFEEAYLSPDSAFARYRESTGWHVPDKSRTALGMHAFLRQITASDVPHGTVFNYLSPNSDLLGWVCERAGGSTLATLLSDLIWKPIGAIHCASMTLDNFGSPRAAGGFGCTLRDMARFGECMRLLGTAAGRQIIPRAWVDDIRRNGDRDAWNRGSMSDWLPSGCYRSQWWITNDEQDSYFAAGIYGQWVYIDPKSAVVIVKQASPPIAPADLTRFRFELEALGSLARQC
jgi:CubicO group peptidase (beta-lactamase class C family)